MQQKKLTREELNKKFNVTEELLDEWESEIETGVFSGEPGRITLGRPRLYSSDRSELVGVSFKESKIVMQSLDKRAAQAKMTRSQYIRHLIAADLIVNDVSAETDCSVAQA